MHIRKLIVLNFMHLERQHLFSQSSEIGPKRRYDIQLVQDTREGRRGFERKRNECTDNAIGMVAAQLQNSSTCIRELPTYRYSNREMCTFCTRLFSNRYTTCAWCFTAFITFFLLAVSLFPSKPAAIYSERYCHHCHYQNCYRDTNYYGIVPRQIISCS